VQYVLPIYDEPGAYDALSAEDHQALHAEYDELSRDLGERGAFIGANQFQPVSTARTVRVKDTERIVTDGPFAETRQTLGGYYLIDVESMDEAIEWAAKIPSARLGPGRSAPCNGDVGPARQPGPIRRKLRLCERPEPFVARHGYRASHGSGAPFEQAGRPAATRPRGWRPATSWIGVDAAKHACERKRPRLTPAAWSPQSCSGPRGEGGLEVLPRRASASSSLARIPTESTRSSSQRVECRARGERVSQAVRLKDSWLGRPKSPYADERT
jgi:hypothetical protein